MYARSLFGRVAYKKEADTNLEKSSKNIICFPPKSGIFRFHQMDVKIKRRTVVTARDFLSRLKINTKQKERVFH